MSRFEQNLSCCVICGALIVLLFVTGYRTIQVSKVNTELTKRLVELEQNQALSTMIDDQQNTLLRALCIATSSPTSIEEENTDEELPAPENWAMAQTGPKMPLN